VGADFRVTASDQRLLRQADLAVSVHPQPSMIAEVAIRLVYLMLVRVLNWLVLLAAPTTPRTPRS